MDVNDVNALSHRRAFAVAFPIVLSNATVPILGAVDTAVVGQLGQAAPIGAVGLGAVIASLIYWAFGFLRMATTGLVAQARGAGDVSETGALLTRGMMIAAIAGLTMIVCQVLLFAAAFSIAPASAEVEDLARTYLSIRIWGAPATLAIYALTGWLIAMERTRGVLALQLVMNGVNASLDLLFVLGLGWGVAGVAAATLIAEYVGLGLGLWLCAEAFAGDQWRDWARVFDRAKLRRMAAVSRDILIRSVVLQITYATFIFYGASFGDVTLAANQVLVQFLSIAAYSMDGFAFAAESFVGQAMGQRSRMAVRRASVVMSQWGVGCALASSALFLTVGPVLIDLMTTAPDVRMEARSYLPWLAAAIALSAPGWMLDGIFIGATRTREMRNAMLVSGLIYAVAIIVLAPRFENAGLWAALLVLNIARAVTLGWRYPALERGTVEP